jgi:branched-chain amino acid transport system permease protein
VTTVLNITIGGLINGGIYALISMGLSLQYGVARILNVSHGEFIMLAAFMTWAMTASTGVHPLLALVICCPFMFVVGYILHITVYRILGKFSPPAAYEGNAMLLSFGLMFILSNIAMKIWGSQLRGYDFMTYPVNVLGAGVPANRLVVLLLSLAVSLLFYTFLARTRLGKSIRASSQDAVAASMMGVKINRVMAICFGIGVLLAGIAGSLLSMIYQISATMGMNYTVIALIVVVLGGMGSISGSLIGGLILGFAGSLVGYIDPSLTMVVFYVIILALLLVRPAGLMGR